MKIIALSSILVFVSAVSEIESNFLNYITKFGKSYKNMAEFEMRLREFALKDAAIAAHNVTESKFTVGHNQMSDWTEAEYKAILTYKAERVVSNHVPEKLVNTTYSPINWQDTTNGLNCMNHIVNQAQCGSCWAFSTQASMESKYCIQSNGTLLKFSEQMLVDCDKTCSGCNGGLVSRAFNWLEDHFEMSDKSYPYTSQTGVSGSCKYNVDETEDVQVSNWAWVTANDPDAMKAVLQSNPMSVAIQADQLLFQIYSGGIFSDTRCGTDLDHATNVVGWGTDSNGTEYWIMRNSWGTTWGDQGYMSIEIVDGPGICGIQSEPLWPTTTGNGDPSD